MLQHIKDLTELENEALKIDDFINITCSEDINEALQRGNDLIVYLARTGKMLADAKYWQDKALSESILKQLNLDITPSILNKLVSANCQKENYIVNWIDRLNSSITHQLDFIRTMISKAKVEMQYGH